MTEAQLAWVAGVFEGEGSISFVGKQGVTVRIGMTDEDVVRRLYQLTGVGQVGGPYPGTNEPKWVWYVGKRGETFWLLKELLPWLGFRRRARAGAALARLDQPRTRRLKPIEHGTYAGEQAERKRGLPICDECRIAAAAYQRARRRREAGV